MLVRALSPAGPAPLAAGSTQNFTVPGLSCGTLYYFALKTADEAGNLSGISNSPSTTTGTCAPPPGAMTQRVNAGGGAYTDGGGNLWSADRAYSPGSWGYVGGITESTRDPIANTNDDPLYQSERTGTFSYRSDVPNGLYDVILHFAEIYHNAAGKRSFDVLIEGVLKLDNFDVYAAAPGHDVAVIRAFPGVSVQDGQLTINFVTVKDKAKVSAISVTSSPP